MANELIRKENMPEVPPGNQSLSVVEELGQSAVSQAGVTELESLVAQTEVEDLAQGTISQAAVTGLESLVVQKNEELAKANTHLSELEQAVASRDSEIATLKQAKAESEERLATISSSLAEAIASYKAVVVQANPEVIEELISGDTVESIDESLGKAKSLVSKVRQGVEAEISLARVPAGAPERTTPDLSALSPREKIQYAIGGKR